VGRWLAESKNPLLEGVSIYPQGSVSLQTTVKPFGRNEHDVDLVCHLPHLHVGVPPTLVKRLIGDRLAEHGHYAKILQEMTRCWRLNYANEFHLDITPSIPNFICRQGGEWVPDRNVQDWKASNPKGYRRWFEVRAELAPRYRFQKSVVLDEKRAHVEPYPERSQHKGVLRRAIQLAKAHRDRYFEKREPDLAPISVIITTLAARSYELCVTTETYDNEFDLLADVIRRMPEFIESRYVDGRLMWFVPNETTLGENFAEKWNHDPRLAGAFIDWHRSAYEQLSQLSELDGMDQLGKSLSGAYGSERVRRVFDSMTDEIAMARETGKLAANSTSGLIVVSNGGQIVQPNTFYGG
jgi:hypothetical protein